VTLLSKRALDRSALVALWKAQDLSTRIARIEANGDRAPEPFSSQTERTLFGGRRLNAFGWIRLKFA
jgi:hypothetical protein